MTTPTVNIVQQTQRIQNQTNFRFSLPKNCVSYLVTNQGLDNILFDGGVRLVPGQSTGATTADPIATTLVGDFPLSTENSGDRLDVVVVFQKRAQ